MEINIINFNKKLFNKWFYKAFKIAAVALIIIFSLTLFAIIVFNDECVALIKSF